jgi:hypothetical protein
MWLERLEVEMLYQLAGKFFICLLVFLVAWGICVFVKIKTGDKTDWGGQMMMFFFIGPFIALIAAVLFWWLLPAAV